MTPSEIQRFIRAGNATFTLQSRRTDTHFTYNVRARQRGSREMLFARVLIAPDTYGYLGMISLGRLVQTGASKISAQAPSYAALEWFLRRLERGELPPSVTFRHEGRCGRCNRVLTTPASIDTGLGPDCAEALGVAHEAVRGPSNAPLQHLPKLLALVADGLPCSFCKGTDRHHDRYCPTLDTQP